MNFIFRLLIIFLISFSTVAREQGETEITTEDGIEVFQNEKFYLLKKNVKIISDNFYLNADDVRIDFDKSLYDITELNAKGNINFSSEDLKINGRGETLKFETKIEKLKVEGLNSELITSDVEMFSDGYIEVNNLNGNFSLKGLNSKLINSNIMIEAHSIDGTLSDSSDKKQISYLNIYDEQISYVKNNDSEMFAKKIIYNSDTSIIELIDSVTIIRDGEKISGDYGTLDTKNNSYKIKSEKQTKVKVVIQNNEQ